jgi:ABC-2 type transport system permease protein
LNGVTIASSIFQFGICLPRPGWSGSSRGGQAAELRSANDSGRLAADELMTESEVRTGAAPGPLRLLLWANGLGMWRRFKALSRQSRLLSSVIFLFIASYLVLAFLLFRLGLRFIEKFPGLGPLLSERLLFLLFFFLLVLLLLSNLVVSYSNLFRNREASFLLTLPIPTTTIFQWKLIESAVLASWAFVFLVAPLVAAFGMARDVAWHFYPATTAMVGLFIVLPAVAGAFLAVQTARYLDRRLFQVLALGLVLLLIGVAGIWLRPEPLPEDMPETRVLAVLDKMLTKTRFAQFPFWPSYWLSSSVLLWAEGALVGAEFWVLVMVSYVLFLGGVVWARMGRLFYAGSSAVQSRSSLFGHWGWVRARQQWHAEHKYRPGLLERLAARLPLLAPEVRAMVVKDTRVFWRDTTQWAQSLMLFGLLGVYIFNLRHFTQQLTSPFWIHLVSYLNLGACSLNLATLTTRFVYPQFSLEGKRLWIIGMSPLGLEKVLAIKFWLAAFTSELVTLGLISLSCYMLKMPLVQTVFFAGAVTVMTLTLTGLAVGLGALYPNFREENPSKVVSGFGGTFCLVLSFLYILASVVLLAMSSHWGGTRVLSSSRAGVCAGSFLALSLALGWIPYRLGLRQVRYFELKS